MPDHISACLWVVLLLHTWLFSSQLNYNIFKGMAHLFDFQKLSFSNNDAALPGKNNVIHKPYFLYTDTKPFYQLSLK